MTWVERSVKPLRPGRLCLWTYYTALKKRIPKFKNEEQEREFWAAHDSAKYMDWTEARRHDLPNLKPSTKTISLRLPEQMLDSLKVLANKRDVPYQSLLKLFLFERIEEELKVHGERAYRIARLTEIAAEVLGSEGEAKEWMKEPNFALGDQIPLEMARTEPGAALVECLLGQIEHGIPA